MTAAVPPTDADVAAAVEAARVAVTALRKHPANRIEWPRSAAAAAVRAARASAALDGAPLALDGEATTVTDPILAGSLRVAAGLGSMVAVWPRSPLQVLARLHTLAAADIAPAAELGRPRPEIGQLLPAVARLPSATGLSGPVQVAMVHGTLLALRPFDHANGVVARAAARLTMITSAFDPAGLTVPEAAYLRAADRYRKAAAAFATGDPQAVLSWQWQQARWLVEGVREGVSIADAAV